jgi:hypothetical protein
MSARSRLFVGSLVVVLAILLAVSIFGPRASAISLSVGVSHYVRQTNGLLAHLTLTNRGSASIAVPLRYQCKVEGADGSTNYTADTSYTIFLEPEQSVALSHRRCAVPLPPDTKAWTVRLRVRQQTRKESLIFTVHRWQVVSPRILSKLSGPPKSDETFHWTECQSGTFGVSLGQLTAP